MRKKRDYAYLILLLASLAVFAFAAWKLFGIYSEYHKGTETYEELQDYVQEPKEKDEPSSEDGTSKESPEDTENIYLQVDFAGLKKVNPDVIAWIQIPALDISYPVVQGKDNYYYLHHMFDGQENKNGSIFVDYHNQPDFSDSNTIVYGHNMKNGSVHLTVTRTKIYTSSIRIFISMFRKLYWNIGLYPAMLVGTEALDIPTPFRNQRISGSL